MKTTHTLISIITIAAILIGLSSVTTSTTQTNDGRPAYVAPVVNPDIPLSMSFCGKTIDLDKELRYERIDRELTSMAYTHGSTLLQLKRANKYFPVIAPILKAQGVHPDVIYLACVESTLNERARSGAGAAGLWQFMEGTAKEYGLEVNSEVDERYNIELATAAACKFLKKAYQKYGDWSTAMESYNGGMGRISQELEKQYVDNGLDLYLTDETQRYPYRIMATKLIFENPRKYGFNLRADQLYAPLDYSTVTVDTSIDDWAAWAANKGITYADLREANPWIRAKKLTNKTGKSYTVKIPRQTARSNQHIKVYDNRWVK